MVWGEDSIQRTVRSSWSVLSRKMKFPRQNAQVLSSRSMDLPEQALVG